MDKRYKVKFDINTDCYSLMDIARKVEESDKVLYDFYMSLQNYIWE